MLLLVRKAKGRSHTHELLRKHIPSLRKKNQLQLRSDLDKMEVDQFQATGSLSLMVNRLYRQARRTMQIKL